MGQDEDMCLLGRVLKGEKGTWREDKACKTNSGNFLILSRAALVFLNETEQQKRLGDTLLQFLHFKYRENITWGI